MLRPYTIGANGVGSIVWDLNPAIWETIAGIEWGSISGWRSGGWSVVVDVSGESRALIGGGAVVDVEEFEGLEDGFFFA